MPVVEIDAPESAVSESLIADLSSTEDEQTAFGLYDAYSLIYRPDCFLPMNINC